MKHILITGTSRGIGHATARELLTRGYHVFGTSTSGKSGISHARFDDYLLKLDEPSSITSCIDQISKSGERLDGLVNNAGILLEDWDDPEIDMELLRRTLDVNLLGTIQLTEALLPLINKNGHVINLGSGWGAFGDTEDTAVPHYKISKAGMHMYTRLLAERLKARNITVSALDPGWVETDMGGTSAPRAPEDAAKEIADLLERNVETGSFWYRGKRREW